MGFKFLRADENILRGGTVSGGAASGFDDDWLVDGRVNRAAKAATGTQTWTATAPASGAVNFVAVANHNVDAARAITIGGDISAALTGPAARANGINVNPWATVASVTATVISVAVSSNSVALAIGELIAGRLRETTYGLRVRTPFIPESEAIRHETEYGSVLSYERPFIRRSLVTSLGATQSDLDQLIAWYESTRANTRPSVILPFDDQQDAWCVEFTALTYEPLRYSATDAVYDVRMDFLEVPRYRR